MEKARPRIVDTVKRLILRDNIRVATANFCGEFPIAERLELGSIQMDIFKDYFSLYALEQEARKRRFNQDFDMQRRFDRVKEELEEKLEKDKRRLVEDTLRVQLANNKYYAGRHSHYKQIKNQPAYIRAVRAFVDEQIQEKGTPTRLRNAANVLSREYFAGKSREEKRQRVYQAFERVSVKDPKEKGPFDD